MRRPKNVTRAWLIRRISPKIRVTRKDCNNFLDALVDEIKDALERGEKVLISNFISIEPVYRGERIGRDPTTGNMVEYPPYKTVRCVPSQALKDAVNGKRGKRENEET